MKRTALITAVAAFAALVLAGSASALDGKAAVDAAKAAGVVGEQADGFLGWVRPSSDPALKAAVQEINQGRAALYRETAQKNGVSVEAAGAATFNQVVQSRLKPGEFYRPAGGAWTKK
jgi:uncharacterized protein